MSQHGCPERLSNRTKGFQEEGGSEPTMEVLVETLTGTAFEMTVSPSDTIFAIKSKIFRVEGIPVAQQHLLYNLKELEDSSSLSEHAIGDGARLRLVLGMRGGPISTRRLPQPAPAAADFWPARIERLLDSNRDDGDWSGGGGGSGAGAGAGSGAGCKVTVLVFRDGERVNMLRVKENTDGTYSPIDHAKYSSPLQPSGVAEPEPEAERGGGGQRAPPPPPPPPPHGADNVLTHAKMADLRRRMDTLSLLRHNRKHAGGDMQKTRSEETLSVCERERERDADAETDVDVYSRSYTFEEDAALDVAPSPRSILYDSHSHFTRYEYDCSFADRYTLLPPIGTRTESEQSVGGGRGEGAVAEVVPPSMLRKEGRDRDRDRRRRDLDTLAPISTDLGAVVGSVEWRSSGAGAGGGHSASASSLRLAGGGGGGGTDPAAPPRAPLASYYSSSTSDLHSTHRVLPALSRHRNRSHLHLSDESLPLPLPVEVEVETVPVVPVQTRSKRERCCRCRKRLGAATLLRCRCGAACCAEHRYPDTHACRLYHPSN